jgi:hypothetical protein
VKGQGWTEKRTDETTLLAQALLTSEQPARANVWCGERKHRLGRIYDIPGRELTLALIESVMLGRELDPDTEHPEEQVAFLAGLYALMDDLRTIRRCRCGTWSIDTAVIRDEYEHGSRDIGTGRSWPRRGESAARPL